MSVLSSQRKITEINNNFGYVPSENNPLDERLFTDSVYVNLEKKHSFFQSRLRMAKSDSIGLTINLLDSLASLELNGVVIHKTKIKRSSVCNLFNLANTYAVNSMFSIPFNISNDFSTIRKEPLMIKMAPKDTSEYQPDIIPDTSGFEPVNYILEMDNGIRIFIFQEKFDKKSEKRAQLLFDFNYRVRTTLLALKDMAGFQVPDYRMYIKIWIPKADAKIIYRAMPKQGQVVVYR